ncbi:SUKH-4 family immunity protein [Streptomyces sp. AM8-1-1]|uniref:SUKH-4 family immunity protein n=1 Tax=Streptomyces sp. AM8-1-1 TaxID=3075825 RepID=UPI0028C47259|nr:SUKH-4 family immunity protein [Streptomyces sp. AM8-1-1]WNO70465.1 SUKH-4 family immunity protein [Streptomyces sp. AM8-1-1]
MSTTDFVVPAHALPASITHEATRRRLTGTGLPAEHRLIRFAPLAESRVVSVPALLAEGADPAQLDPYIADLLLIGHLRIDEYDAQEVVLDGASGRVFSMDLFEKSPGLIDVIPLAPSLDALARFLEHVDDFRSMRGRFAALTGRTGPDAVAEASRLLMSAFTDEDWGHEGWGTVHPPSEWEHPLPAFWRIAAVIRPLALVAGPGQGLRLDLPTGLLDDEFGPDEMVRIEASALPAALVHEPTRRFLTEVGLPRDGIMFGMDGDDTPLPTLPEDRASSQRNPAHRHLWNGTDELPPDAEHMVVLGGLMHDFIVLIDGRTGALHYAEYNADRVVPVNADISTLAFTVWMHSREGRLDEEHHFTHGFYHQLAETMTEVLSSVDPVACLPATDEDDYRYWPEVFHDEAGAVL